MGAVGSLQNIQTPSKVAERVMPRPITRPSRRRALKSAKAEGFPEENPLTECHA